MANVLIVDDEEMDRLIASRAIEQAGHTPFFAGDGESTMKMYKENDIDLVITDLRMPKADGLSLIRGIIAHDPRAAIIAMSGLAQHLDAAEKAGAVAGLAKPVAPQALIDIVQRVLGEAPSQPAQPWSRSTGEDLFGN
jgi:DNA-binding NtrC family response regulator